MPSYTSQINFIAVTSIVNVIMKVLYVRFHIFHDNDIARYVHAGCDRTQKM